MKKNIDWVGKSAPQFELPNQDGEKIRLSDYKGRWLVLYFYPKDNTPGCTTEGIQFSAFLEKFQALDCDVIGVSKDSIASHCRFREKKSLTITLLSDSDLEVLKQYGVWREKKMYGKTFLGAIRSTFLIDPAGKIVAHWDKVKVAGHVEQVLTRLQESVTNN